MSGNIADARRNFFGLSLAHALAEGRLFALDIFQNLAAAGSYTLDFMTAGRVLVPLSTINTLSTDTLVEFISGGTYSGGAASNLAPLNFDLNTTPDLVSAIDQGVTIDTVGTVGLSKRLLGAGQGVNRSLVSGNSQVGMILAPLSQYALKITNNDASAQDFALSLMMVKL